ncbi:MAG TPA: LPS assembly protein LptD, partial [Methylophilaceae bacterium]|nr:LPS assembly protein LptD [Methylophilaceae bacterium]
MQTFRNLAHAFVLLTAMSGQTQAAENSPAEAPDADEITIDAQRLEVYLDRKMSAIGNAEVHRSDQVLYGDRIDYDMINEELHVSGNSRMVQGGTVVTGPDLRMKLGEREGEMQDPVFTMRNTKALVGASTRSGKTARPGDISFARGSAKSVTLDGPDRERFTDARYTSCEEGVDDWYLRAKDLELDHSTDTATAKNASIEFKGVPILYTPWIDFPFSGQRKSGFLSPTFGTTSLNGAEFALPYYWNIAPDMDATITPRYMSKRGTMLGGDFRYLGEQYSGRDNLDYLQHDDLTGQTRWFADLEHKQNFGNGWSGSYDIKRVSDDKYLSDMTTNIVATSTVNLPQQGILSYGTSSLNSSFNFNAIAQEFQTLDNKSYPYFRLPEFNLSASRDWDNVTGNMYAQWVSFEQSNDAPDNVKGSRLTSYPSFSLPLNSSYGYIVPKLGAKYWTYNLSGNTVIPGTTENYQSDSTALPIFSVDSGVYFDRN